jgi:hypothetical protein
MPLFRSPLPFLASFASLPFHAVVYASHLFLSSCFRPQPLSHYLMEGKMVHSAHRKYTFRCGMLSADDKE